MKKLLTLKNRITMWNALTIDFKILFFLFQKKFYSFQVKRFLRKYHEALPQVVESIKLQTIADLERLIQETDKWIVTFEKEVQVAVKQLELNQALYVTSSTPEHLRWVECMDKCVKQYQKNLICAQDTKKEAEQKLLNIQCAGKIVVVPFRNPFWIKFRLAQINKKHVHAQLKLYSDYNRKFF